MGFLGWITKRNGPSQQTVAEKTQGPERAKEMYDRQAGLEKANLTPMDRMPPDQQAKVDKIKAALEKATRHIDSSAHVHAAAPVDGNGSREATRQNMTGQEKTAPALSPTSTQTGQPATEKTPSKQATTTKAEERGRAQSMPRTRPSWER